MSTGGAGVCVPLHMWAPHACRLVRCCAVCSAFLCSACVAVGSAPQALVRDLNPEVSMLRVTGGLGRAITLASDDILDIVQCPVFSSPRAVAFRNLLCPGWHIAHATPGTRAGTDGRRASVAETLERLSEAERAHQHWRGIAATIDGVQPLDRHVGAVFVSTPVVFHPRRLRTVLSSMVHLSVDAVANVLDIRGGVALDGAGAETLFASRVDAPAVWRVKGFVKLLLIDAGEDGPTGTGTGTGAPNTATAAAADSSVDGSTPTTTRVGFFQVDAVPGLVRVHAVESRHDMGHTTSQLVFIGSGLAPDSVTATLMRARPRQLTRLQPRTVSSLSPEEVQAVRHVNLEAPLPPGTWFDGHQYMDHTGIPTPDHPHLPRFLAAFISEHNAAVEAHNAVVEAREAAAEAELSSSVPTERTSGWWDVTQVNGNAANADVVRTTWASDVDLKDLLLLRKQQQRGATATTNTTTSSDIQSPAVAITHTRAGQRSVVPPPPVAPSAGVRGATRGRGGAGTATAGVAPPALPVPVHRSTYRVKRKTGAAGEAAAGAGDAGQEERKGHEA